MACQSLQVGEVGCVGEDPDGPLAQVFGSRVHSGTGTPGVGEAGSLAEGATRGVPAHTLPLPVISAPVFVCRVMT